MLVLIVIASHMYRTNWDIGHGLKYIFCLSLLKNVFLF